MKSLNQIFGKLALILFGLGLFSCADDDGDSPPINRQVAFGYQEKVDDSGRFEGALEPSKIRVTVQDMDGEVIIAEGITLNLFPFGDSYVSEHLEMSPGTYQVVLFQVLDDEGEVIYAAPLGGSEKANLVTQPLPQVFQIGLEEVTTVVPQVVAVLESDTPADFGYLEFGFEVIETFEFSFAVLSDWDSSTVASGIHVVERDAEYNELSRYETSYDGTGFTTLQLKEHAFAYEIQVLDQEDYHGHSLVSRVELLKSPEQSDETNEMFKPTSENGHLLFLSRKDKAVKYYVPLPPYSYQSWIFLYVSLDPCEHFMRVDFAGWQMDEGVELRLVHHFWEEPDPLGPGWGYGISGAPAPWGWRAENDQEVIPFVDSGPSGNYLMTGIDENPLNICDEYPESYFRIENEISLLNFNNGESTVDLMLEMQWNSDENWWSTWCNECGTIFYQDNLIPGQAYDSKPDQSELRY